jgi:radical SAM-linked protein
MVQEGNRVRYRFRFRKSGPLLALGHLDFARLVARMFRRAGVTVAMSQGFHPQPRISLALALPLGQEGRNEYLEAILLNPPEEPLLLKRLNGAAPDGLEFKAVQRVDGKGSLSAELVAVDYRVLRADGEGFSKENIERFLALESLQWQRQKKGGVKTFDIRGLVLGMERINEWGELRLRLALKDGVMARPTEVIEAAFGLTAGDIEIRREELFIDRNGQLLPPI